MSSFIEDTAPAGIFRAIARIFSATRKIQGGLFLTTVDSERIRGQFTRLKLEAAGLADFHLIINPRDYPNPRSEIRHQSHAELFPVRSGYAAGGMMLPGYTDLIFVPVAMALPYSHVWVVEYDVDYAGHWRDFFLQFQGDDADVLTTTLAPWSDNPEWYHWRWAETPNYISRQDRYRCFHPIIRLSQRFMRAYAKELLSSAWRGHSEFTIPTIARHLGFDVRDIGGHGPLCPPGSRGRNYFNTPNDPHLCPGTFVWRPARHFFFHEAGADFEHPNLLYHPVKPDVGNWEDTSSPDGQTPG